MNIVMQLFAVYDLKAGSYFPPLACQNKLDALRLFGDLLTDPQTRFSKHPEDYRLYAIGEWDTIAGTVHGYATGPVLCEEGLAMVKEA